MKHIKKISIPRPATDWWGIINVMNPIIAVVVLLGEVLNTVLMNKDYNN